MDNTKTAAADLAANFEVAELEPRLENVWAGETEPSLPGGGWEETGRGNG
ncbi:hypothetical protein [Hymenobacter sp. YC55]|nr:hypothetical protein [Hymenobacter sp. YC55]MDF7815293.1 hypothetical protein [Hymenobacter sp. YC55]